MLHKFLLFIVFALQLPLVAQVVVEQQLTTSSIRIGEQVQLQTKVSVDSGRVVSYPEFAHNVYVLGVELLRMSDVDTISLNEGRRFELHRTYLLTSFDSALYTLPPFAVVVEGDTFQSVNSVGLKVSTVPVDTMNANDYAGPHAVLSIPYEWSAGLWSLLLLDILLVVIVVLLIKRIKANKPITKRMVITPPPPAHQPAIEAIEKIRETRDIESSEALKSYYDSLTEILRNYIEQRFGFNALELTSAEIIARLQQSNDAVALHELREILETADLVKFAKYETSMSEADCSLVMAIDYVNSTKQKPEELPMPEVKVVTVGETQQQRVRTTMIVAVVVLAITSLVLFGWGVKEIYDCFL